MPKNSGRRYEKVWIDGWKDETRSALRSNLCASCELEFNSHISDYVLAIPQAPVEYWCKFRDHEPSKLMEETRRISSSSSTATYTGRSKQDQTDILVHKVKFQQSEVDECLFYCDNEVYVLYSDDSILAGRDKKEINKGHRRYQSCEAWPSQ
jgi:hypothetical protein